MTGCADVRLLMHGLLDGELDAANALRCEQHLVGCTGCAQEYRAMQALRQAIRTGNASSRAPEALRSHVLQALDAELGPARPPDQGRSVPPRSWQRWMAAGSGLALAASLTLFVAAPLPTIWKEREPGVLRKAPPPPK